MARGDTDGVTDNSDDREPRRERDATPAMAGGDGCVARVGLIVKGVGEYDGDVCDRVEPECEDAHGDKSPVLPSGDENVTEDSADCRDGSLRRSESRSGAGTYKKGRPREGKHRKDRLLCGIGAHQCRRLATRCQYPHFQSPQCDTCACSGD